MSDSFCIRPWISLGIRTYGGLCICPQMDYQAKHPHLSTIDPDNFRNSPEMSSLRQDMLDGKEIPACRGCKIRETINDHSPELRSKILTEKKTAPLSLTSLRLDFGNKCNLMCPTCGIHGSSNWEKVIREILPEHQKDLAFDWPQKHPVKSQLLENVLDITLSGGEPMMIEECEKTLRQIVSNKRAKEVSVHYITNATIDPTPFIPLWQEFEKVVLELSIDGTGNVFEFLRSPAKWNEVEKNIHRFLALPLNCRIVIVNHVSIFNFFQLPEYLEWFRSLEKKYPERSLQLKLMPVEKPAYFSLGSFPEELKVKALSWLAENHFLHPDLPEFRNQLKSGSISEAELRYQRKIFMNTYKRYGNFKMAEIFPLIYPTVL